MAKIKRKTVNIIVTILTVILLVSVSSAVLFSKTAKEKNISTTAFVIGKITDNGEFLSSDDYVCTNKLIGVDGLTIKPKYNAKSKFQVFFYDINYKYVYNTEILSNKYEFIDAIPFVEYCRIMILPERGEQTAEEFKINVFNKRSYVNEFKITVAKEQTFASYKDYFEKDLSLQNFCLKSNWDAHAVEFVEKKGIGVSKPINISDVDNFYFVTDKALSKDEAYYLCLFTSKSGYLKSSFVQTNEYAEINNVYVYKIDCSNLDIAYFNYDLNSNCHLYLERN